MQILINYRDVKKYMQKFCKICKELLNDKMKVEQFANSISLSRLYGNPELLHPFYKNMKFITLYTDVNQDKKAIPHSRKSFCPIDM